MNLARILSLSVHSLQYDKLCLPEQSLGAQVGDAFNHFRIYVVINIKNNSHVITSYTTGFSAYMKKWYEGYREYFLGEEE